MKKSFLLFGVTLLLTTFILISCKKKEEEPAPTTVPAPISDFTFTGSGANAPANVVFTNASQNATTYSWNFGDGGTSTDINPTHTYSVAGTFNVVLTATGNGGTNSKTKVVTINSPATMPTANFTYSGAGNYAPCNVTFSNTSQNATTYSWDFGDNGTSTETSPSHTYTSGGTYTVTLVATNANGTNSIQKTVNILAAPTHAFVKKVTVTAMPFINGSGSGWDPSDGPDVYFKITNANNDILPGGDGSGSAISDVTQSMLPISWNFNAPYFSVPDINTAIYIDLTDYDTFPPDQYIGWCGPFVMSSFTTYPATVSKIANGITVTLDIQWQ